MEENNNPVETQNVVQNTSYSAPYTSLTMWQWLGYLVLFSIPLVNFISLCVIAFSKKTNKNLGNYAKASLIWTCIGVVLMVILFVALGSILFSIFSRTIY